MKNLETIGELAWIVMAAAMLTRSYEISESQVQMRSQNVLIVTASGICCHVCWPGLSTIKASCTTQYSTAKMLDEILIRWTFYRKP
jgi:hypothetical protein